MSWGRIGGAHTVLLDSAGAVWTVGAGKKGQLGHGDEENCSSPQRVKRLPPCVLVAGGKDFTACVAQNGDVFCFGANDRGQLGQGHLNNLNTPHRVEGMPPIRSLACGSDFMMCVGRDSSVWSFGNNCLGQLGLKVTEENVTAPHQVEGMNACQVACGNQHTILLDAEGHLFGCGSSAMGALGLGDWPIRCVRLPFPLKLKVKVHSVHCSTFYSMIRAEDGTLWSAGWNHWGQLGDGGQTDRPVFEQIEGLVSTQVACGEQHVMAIDEKSRLWCWGYRYSTPTIVREDASAVVCGRLHFLLRTTDDRVLAWGDNSCGPLSCDPTAYYAGNFAWTQSTIQADMIRWFDDISPPSSVDWRFAGGELKLSTEEVHQLQEISKNIQLHFALNSPSGPSELSACSPVSSAPPASCSLKSWSWCVGMVAKKLQDAETALAEARSTYVKMKEINDGVRTRHENPGEKLSSTLDEHERLFAQDIETIEHKIPVLKTLITQCEMFAQAEDSQQAALDELLQRKSLVELDAKEMDLVWWRTGLAEYCIDRLRQCGIPGGIAVHMDVSQWQAMGLRHLDACRVQFFLAMMERPGGMDALRQLEQEDCVVCNSCSVWTTENLLAERGIKLQRRFTKEGWIAPWLIYASLTEEQLDLESSDEHATMTRSLQELKQAHRDHLSELTEDDE